MRKYFEIYRCLCRIRIIWKRKKGGLITTGSSNAVLQNCIREKLL